MSLVTVFKVYFVWVLPLQLLISICMQYLCPSPHFQSVSLDLKWVSRRQHVYGSCFCIHSATLCILIGTFTPFIFKVIIDMYVLIAILFIVSGHFCSTFLLFLPLLSSLVIWWLSLVLCLDSSVFCVCVSITDFWFVVSMRFIYSNLYVCVYVIYIYNCKLLISILNAF